MFEKLCAFLEEHSARYTVIEHPPEGNSEKVALVRGTEIGQGAKALVCVVTKNEKIFVLVIVGGDQRVDLKKVATAFQGSKASLAQPDQAIELTGCQIGAIPPFSFNDKLALIVDCNFLQKYREIAFNAGLLDASIVLNTDDYARIAKPFTADIAL